MRALATSKGSPSPVQQTDPATPDAVSCQLMLRELSSRTTTTCRTTGRRARARGAAEYLPLSQCILPGSCDACVGSGRVRLTVAERIWGQACPGLVTIFSPGSERIFFFAASRPAAQRFSQALPYSIYQPASERGEASQFLSQTRSEGNKYRSSQPPFACPALRIPPLPPRQQIRHVERAMLSAECLSLSRVSNHNSCHNYGFFTIINLVLTRLLPVSWEGINYT